MDASRRPRTVVHGLVFPEGLRWHDGALWFSDVFGATVRRTTRTGCEVVARIDGEPSGLGFLPDGSTLVTDMRNGTVLRIAGDDVSVHADLRPMTPHHINDMLVTPAGHAYVGEFGYDMVGGAKPAPAKLILIAPGGAVSVVADDLEFPNGIAMTDDGAILLVAESTASRIVAFDVAPDGGVSGKRTWGVATGFVDGICLDDEGALWVANHANAVFLRMREGGEILDRVEVPGRWALSCALGGEHGTTLFLATSENDGVNFPASIGRIEAVEIDVPAAALG
jgi:sugar lactone lactonase YvrE